MIVNIIFILLIAYVIFFILDLCSARAKGIQQADREYAADRMEREMFYRDMLREAKNKHINTCYNKPQNQRVKSCSDINQINDQNRNKNKIRRKMK